MNNLQELSAVEKIMLSSQDMTMTMIGTGAGGTTMMIGTGAGGTTMMIGIIETGTGLMAGISIRPISGLVSLA